MVVTGVLLVGIFLVVVVMAGVLFVGVFLVVVVVTRVLLVGVFFVVMVVTGVLLVSVFMVVVVMLAVAQQGFADINHRFCTLRLLGQHEARLVLCQHIRGDAGTRF